MFLKNARGVAPTNVSRKRVVMNKAKEVVMGGSRSLA